MPEPRVLVMGVGNVLMGDEGVGIHVVRRLADHAWPANVSVVDGGTGGFHLLSHFEDCSVAVLVDATLDGRPPGTITVLEPRYAKDFPRVLSAHDIGLKDLVESADLLGHLPRIHLVTVSVADLQPMQLTLSPEIEAVVSDAAHLVRTLAEAQARLRQAQPREGLHCHQLK
jgi:hydrogenase maturation protease